MIITADKYRFHFVLPLSAPQLPLCILLLSLIFCPSLCLSALIDCHHIWQHRRQKDDKQDIYTEETSSAGHTHTHTHTHTHRRVMAPLSQLNLTDSRLTADEMWHLTTDIPPRASWLSNSQVWKRGCVYSLPRGKWRLWAALIFFCQELNIYLTHTHTHTHTHTQLWHVTKCRTGRFIVQFVRARLVLAAPIIMLLRGTTL